ncbi:MAG TPA: outer membrane beta-barrel protein [Candidatus Eisenbacteria bacterium]|nr:outer membrane beta-barrel protein [Candidatus Eisenbacteria bacterium]
MSRKWIGGLFAIAVVAFLFAPSASRAESTMKFGITGFGGYNTYAMDDVNDAIDEVNADPDVQSAGISVDKISGGFGLGGGVQLWAADSWVISAEYERLMASTKDEGSVLGTPVSVELKVPANSFVLTGAYLFPSASKARFGLGAGVGYYSTSGTQEVSSPGISFSDEANGNGIGFHFLGVMDYAASSQVHLGLRAGYRVAKTKDLEDSAGDKVYNLDGSEAQVDWSGLMTRAGITFMLGGAD